MRVSRIDLPGRQWNAPQTDSHRRNQRIPYFIVGPENHLIPLAIQPLLNRDTITSNPGSHFNPLILIGASGYGKSHLAGGIANRWDSIIRDADSPNRPNSHREWNSPSVSQPIPSNQLHRGYANSPTSQTVSLGEFLNPQPIHTPRVSYFSSWDLCRLIQQAREEDKLATLRQALFRLRLLVLEDLHLIQCPQYIQEELRLVIDHLVKYGAAVIITSQQPLVMIPSLDISLQDRLSAGLTLRIKPLGTAARLELVQLAADQRGTELSLKRAEQIVQQTAGSAPSLFQALLKHEQGQCEQQGIFRKENLPSPPTDSLISGKISTKAHSSDSPIDLQPRITMQQIVALVARYFSISQSQLRGLSRRRSVVHVRSISVYLARQLTNLSYAQIGQHLGNRDHSTTMHAHRKLQQMLPADSSTQECIEELTRILKSV